MVLRLAAALDVPLRHVNAMLQAAGYDPVYPEPGPGHALPDEVAGALQLMKDHHDPFPLVVVNRTYDVVDLNAGALAVFGAVVADLEQAGGAGLNLVRLTFDPHGAQQALVNFDEVGRPRHADGRRRLARRATDRDVVPQRRRHRRRVPRARGGLRKPTRPPASTGRDKCSRTA